MNFDRADSTRGCACVMRKLLLAGLSAVSLLAAHPAPAQLPVIELSVDRAAGEPSHGAQATAARSDPDLQEGIASVVIQTTASKNQLGTTRSMLRCLWLKWSGRSLSAVEAARSHRKSRLVCRQLEPGFRPRYDVRAAFLPQAAKRAVFNKSCGDP